MTGMSDIGPHKSTIGLIKNMIMKLSFTYEPICKLTLETKLLFS